MMMMIVIIIIIMIIIMTIMIFVELSTTTQCSIQHITRFKCAVSICIVNTKYMTNYSVHTSPETWELHIPDFTSRGQEKGDLILIA